MQEIILWAGGIILTSIIGLVGWFINYIFARLASHEKIHKGAGCGLPHPFFL